MVAQRGFAANRNGASDPYQGTTSVVPAIMALAPAVFPAKIVAARKDCTVSSTGFSR
jgi:hypothetical protein